MAGLRQLRYGSGGFYFASAPPHPPVADARTTGLLMPLRPYALAAFVALAASAALAGCESDVLTVERDIAAPTLTFDLPAAAAAGTVDVVRSVRGFDFDAELENLGLPPEGVESVTVVAVEARLSDPADSLTFAELARGELWLAAPGIDPVLLAELPAEPQGTTSAFAVRDPALDDYLAVGDGELDAIFRVEARETPGDSVAVEIDVTFRVLGGV